MTTPTAALVEEAEREKTAMSLELGTTEYLFAALRRAEAERDEARRDAEAYKRQTQEVSAKAIELTKEVSAKLEQAEAERDAQHAEVLRLTGERDAAREGWQREVVKGLARAQTVCDVVDALDEARSLGFGLGCLLTNSREETEWQVEETRTLRREVRELSERLAGMPMPEDDDPAGKHLMSLINRRRELYQRVDELTATRDLLATENARLQKERDAAAASLNALAKGARHVPCFGECSSERICIACYGLRNLKGWVEWQKRTETERDEARSELAEARAHIATLELLLRGGK